VRVSTEEQADSLNQQKALIENFAKLKGIEVVRIFEDKGISGAVPLIHRPGFVALLEFCEKNNIKTIIVPQMDRLTRNPDDESYIRYELVLRRGYVIMSILDLVVLDRLRLLQQDSLARLAEQVRGVFSAYERQMIGQRVRKGMAKKFPAGLPQCNSLYKATGGDLNKYREIALKVYEMFKQGYSMRRIAQELGISLRMVKFILWLLGEWDYPIDTCPKCGCKQLRVEVQEGGKPVWLVCTNCGFYRPYSRDVLYELMEYAPEFIQSRYPQYVVELLQLGLQLKRHGTEGQATATNP